MKLFDLLSALLIFTLPIANFAYADSSSDSVARCFSDSTTGKDRKDLVRWVFAVIALHPEVATMAPISLEDREKTTKAAGLIFKRLLTESCKNEVQESFKNKDDAAVISGFNFLGKLAMQELTVDPNVSHGFSGIEKYIDVQSLRESLLSK